MHAPRPQTPHPLICRAPLSLIDDGELNAYVPGAVRRKLRLADVLAFREELRERRNSFIADSAAAYDDADIEDIAFLLEQARNAR